MSIADYLLNTGSAMISFGLSFLPENISFFTLADLTSLLETISNFWEESFSIGSHFFPFALFFTILGLVLTMELALLVFKSAKYIINILRGAGA